MEMIRSRNQQAAIPAVLNCLYETGDERDDVLVVDHPVIFTFERPRERMVYWPGLVRNPAHELMTAFTSLAPSEGSLADAAAAVKGGRKHFLFSTPQLVVQGRMASDGRMDLYIVTADTNPFLGAFGQMNLQMSILLELLAEAGKVHVGELTIQHQSLSLRKDVVAELLRASFDQLPEDPYANGLKPRKIDGPLNMQVLAEDGGNVMGHKSKWVRHVAIPLLAAMQAETPAEGRELAKKVKADDWRRSMIEYCDANLAVQQFAQEQAGGEE